MYIKIPPNLVGNDYVVGDVHGMYDLLIQSLKDINFDFMVDRLFVCGDLVDRGPKNMEMVSLIGLPWFFAVRGNHEQWAIDNQRDPKFYQSARTHASHGGMWFYCLDNEHMDKVAKKFQTLPLMLETEVDGKSVGFVHAETNDWDTTRYIIRHLVESDVTHDVTAQKLLWSRHRVKNEVDTILKGIDHVFLGHTVVRHPKRLGNTTFIDTGAVFSGGKMTILNIKDYLNSIKE